MKVLQVSKVPITPKEFVKRSAIEDDAFIIVDGPCIIKEGDKIVAILDMLPVDSEPLLKAVKTIDFPTTKRTGGLLSTSRIFGYRPRNEIRSNFCSATSLKRDNKRAHDVVTDYAKYLDAMYSKYLPEGYKSHEEQALGVLPDWKIKDSVFTSGIINKDNPLKYHFDTGNFDGVFSNMVTLKHGIDGGNLIMPEYNLKIILPNASVLMFDGQSILHGVSPIIKTLRNGYRYTIVFYSLKKMRDCLMPSEELLRIKQHQTNLYKQRANYIKSKPVEEESLGELTTEGK